MSRARLIFVVVVTLVYLFFELRFNAILMDAAGGLFDLGQLNHLEQYGRILTGTAVALLLMQYQLSKQGQRLTFGGVTGIFVVCLVCVGAVYAGVRQFSNYLVDSSSLEFRQASVATALLKSSLIKNTVQIEGISDQVFNLQSGEGKAFLAFMPFIAARSEETRSKVRHYIGDLTQGDALERVGDEASVYRKYTQAHKEVALIYSSYQGAFSEEPSTSQVQSRQDASWADYLSELEKKGHTPFTLDRRHWPRVVSMVQNKVPVPSDWDPRDEDTFRQAVRQKVFAGHETLKASFVGIPPHLSWEAFFVHPKIQSRFHKRLGLPESVTIRPGYPTRESFVKELYLPLLQAAGKGLASAYKKPLAQFAPGSPMYETGRNAATSAIVPPLAISFSLLGAITHAGKLAFLFTGLLLGRTRTVGLISHTTQICKPATNGPIPKGGHSKTITVLQYAVLVLVVVASLLTFRFTETSLTRSQTYQGLIHKAGRDSGSLGTQLMVNWVHIVMVGQSQLYPWSVQLSRASTRALGSRPEPGMEVLNNKLISK